VTTRLCTGVICPGNLAEGSAGHVAGYSRCADCPATTLRPYTASGPERPLLVTAKTETLRVIWSPSCWYHDRSAHRPPVPSSGACRSGARARARMVGSAVVTVKADEFIDTINAAEGHDGIPQVTSSAMNTITPG